MTFTLEVPMNRTSNPMIASLPSFEGALGGIRQHIAEAMVGSTVDVLTSGHTVAHGVVTGVFTATGSPKIIVNGRTYNMNQVITATIV
jgi:hypothetical protein